MKLGLAALALCVGCSVSTTSGTVSLAPLPTGPTQGPRNTVVINPIPSTSYPEVEPRAYYEYLTFVRGRAQAPVPREEDLRAAPDTWCDFMRRGMGRINITDWIMEMASDNTEAWNWLVTAEASAYFICPDQAYKWNP